MSDASVLDQWREASVDKFIPLQASLELTNRCNERCSHCYIDSFKDDKQRLLDTQGWYRVLEQLREAKSLYLILMGGEAMLSPDFWNVAGHGADLGFHVSMISNGQLIKSQEIADRLYSTGVRNITLSFYSMNPEIHDRMTRVKGSHAKIMKAIEYCMAAGLQVGLNTLLTKDNVYGVFDIYEYCLEKDLELKVDPIITPKFSGNMEPTKLRVSFEKLKWFYRERARRWPNSLPKFLELDSGGYTCNAAKGKCAVTAYGELLPCIEIRKPIGSLITDDFRDIWFNPEVDKWRMIKNKDLKTNLDSKLMSQCDHCPGMAMHEHGDAHKIVDFTKQVTLAKWEVYREIADERRPELEP